MSITPVTTPATPQPPVQPVRPPIADAVTPLASPAVIVGGTLAADPLPTYAPTQYTDEVNKDVAALADGSGASLDDQLNAYVDLRDLLFNGSLLYNAGNPQDLQNASDAYDDSALSKEMEQVSDQYEANGMKGVAQAMSGQGLNPDAFNLANVEGFSADQQKMLFVSLMADANYDTVDDWKQGLADNARAWANGQAPVHDESTTSLSQVAARFNLAGPQGMPSFDDLEALVHQTAAGASLVVAHTRNGMPIAIRPGTQAEEQAQIDAASGVRTAAGGTGDADAPPSSDDKTGAAAQALQTLTGPKTTYTGADLALQMLKASAKAQADAKAAPAQAGPYQSGDTLSLTA